jgi:hypothetical protein
VFQKALVVLGFVLSSLGSSAAQQPAPVRVRIYNDANVPDVVVKRAQGVAGRIYEQAGVRLLWEDREDFKAQEKQFCLRIVSHSRNLPGEDFGIAFIGLDGEAMQADVFYSGIERLAMHSSENTAEVLGHVMAHELGHLLLGQKSHSRTGIMQARWGEPQLCQMRMGVLRFEKSQAEAMHARLLDSKAVPENIAVWRDSNPYSF